MIPQPDHGDGAGAAARAGHHHDRRRQLRLLAGAVPAGQPRAAAAGRPHAARPRPRLRLERHGRASSAALEQRGLALNVAQLVGHGTVRAAVKGIDSGAGDARARRRRWPTWSRAALDEGAIGLSTGLGYAPGVFADTDELVGVTAPLRSAAASTPRTRAATSRSAASTIPSRRRPTCARSTRPPRCGARTASRCSTRT